MAARSPEGVGSKVPGEHEPQAREVMFQTLNVGKKQRQGADSTWSGGGSSSTEKGKWPSQGTYPQTGWDYSGKEP